MKYKSRLVSIDECGNELPTIIFCFTDDKKAKTFWKVLREQFLEVSIQQLINPIMVMYDGTEETEGKLHLLAYQIMENENGN